MDYLVNTGVAIGSGDAAPASGVPGEAIDGNAALAQRPTPWPAWAWNMVIGSLRAIIVAAGLVPNRADRTLLLQAVMSVPPGRLLRTPTVFQNAGVFGFVPLAAATLFFVEGVGGGGGGGGTVSTGASVGSAAGGGSAGAYLSGWITLAVMQAALVSGSLPVTIGAGGGGGGPTGAGANGGTTSVGSLMTMPGGVGAPGTLSNTATVAIGAPGGSGAAPSAVAGSPLIGGVGSCGQPGLASNTGGGYQISGCGGSSSFGAGGQFAGANTMGIPGLYGGGGSGACTGFNSAGLSGGGGGFGLVRIWEYR